jgi:hypothetical protein
VASRSLTRIIVCRYLGMASSVENQIRAGSFPAPGLQRGHIR